MPNFEDMPSKSARIFVEDGRLEEFLSELEKFAAEGGYSIQAAETSPSGKSWIIQIESRDFRILLRNPFSVEEFQVRFYESNIPHTTNILQVYDRLRERRLSIKGISFVEEK